MSESFIRKGVKFTSIRISDSSCQVLEKDGSITECIFKGKSCNTLDDIPICSSNTGFIIFVLDPDPVNLTTYRLTQ